LVRIADVRLALSVTGPTASKLVDEFESQGLLQEITGFRRNRIFRYTPYLALFRETPEEAQADEGA
jgi:DNA-binding MarR family transcriptional regulator